MSQQENCDNNCSSCGVEGCPSRQGIAKSQPHELSSFKKTIAIVSGKGGVGKSLVTSLLAVSLRKKAKEVALLDADVTGPSIPRSFGLEKKQASGDETSIYAIKSKTGIRTMSTGNLLENETDPVIWRGPMIASMVTSLYTSTVYGDCDFLLIDMPPGTGDVPLTVFQSLNVDGIIVVASPQELVGVIVEKAVNMAKQMDIPVLGLVENMSYALCPDCGKRIDIYGKSGKAKETAERYGVPMLDEIPIDPELSRLVDLGLIEDYEKDVLPLASEAALDLLK